MPLPIIAAGACATMAALGDCFGDTTEEGDVEEGLRNEEEEEEKSNKRITTESSAMEAMFKRKSSVLFQDELPIPISLPLSLPTLNHSYNYQSVSSPVSNGPVSSIRSILSKKRPNHRGDGNKQTSIRKSEPIVATEVEPEPPNGFVDGDFHSGKIRDITVSGAWTMAYHPGNDAVLAVGMLNGEGVVMYETNTYTVIGILERDDAVSTLAWLSIQLDPDQSQSQSHSTSYLAVGGLDGTVALYSLQVDLIELKGADLLYEYQCHSQVRCMDIAIHNESIILAVGEKLGAVTFCSFSPNGTHVETQIVDQHNSGVLGLAISPSASLLAVCTKGGCVTVRQIHQVDGQFQLGVDLWHMQRNGPLNSIVFSKDESRLVFGGYDKQLVLVDTMLWDVVRELRLEGTINTVSYDPLDRYLAVGCRDKSFILFDTSTFFPIKSIHTSGWVTSLSWGRNKSSVDADIVAIRSELTCISILDLTPIHKVNVTLSAHRDNIASLSWSVDGRFLARIHGSHVLISHSVNDFQDVATLELQGTVRDVAFCTACDKTDLIACVGLDGHINLIRLICQGDNFQLVLVKSSFLEENLWVLAWKSNGSSIATGGRGKKLYIVSASDLAPICDPIEIEGQIWSIDFLPQIITLHAGSRANSYSLAVGSSDGVATLYDVDNFMPTLSVSRSKTVRCLAFHPLLPLLAIGDSGNTVSIVDFFGEVTAHELYVGGRVNTVAYSPAGDFLVIGTDDGCFTFHETATFRIVQKIKMNSFALSAAFSGSTGQFLALGTARDDYMIIRLGPFLGTDLIPLGTTGGVDHLPTWALNESLYRSGEGPSLVQRNMIEGSQASLRRAASILQDHPDAIYAFDRSTGDGCFQTALQLKKPNLLKIVMTTLVDGTLEADSHGRRTILTTEMPALGLDTLQHIIASFPPQYIVEILHKMTYIKVPFTNPREISTDYAKECGSSSYTDPWDISIPQRGLKRSDRDVKIEVDDSKGFVYRTPAVLPLPGLGTAKFLSSLLNRAPPTVFDNAAMGLVLHIMWEHFIRPYFLLDLFVFLLYYIFWTVFVDLTSSTTSSTTDSDGVIGNVVWICLVVLNTFFAMKEIIQSNFGRRRGYFLSLWNVVDVVSIMLVYCYITSTSIQGGTGTGNVPLAVFTTLLLAMKLLSYLRGFDSTGWLISVLLQNFRDVGGFIIVLLVMLFGFTTSFRLLFGDVKGECAVQLDSNGELKEECSVNPYSSIGQSFLSTFELTVLGSYSSGVLGSSQYTPLAVVTFIVAVVSVLVVALNALIAVLADSYAQVQEKAVANRRKERAELIVEYLSILPPPKRRDIERNTRYFHALLEADEDGDLLIHKDDWQGGLNALRRDLEELNTHSAELHHHAMDELKADMENNITVLRKEMVSLLQDVSRDLKEMRRVQKEGGVTFNGSNVAKAVRAVKSMGNSGLFGGGKN